MKYLLSAIVSLFVYAVVDAQQLPNGGFENWSLKNEYIEPDGWISTNAYAYFGAVETCYPFEDAHTGKWAAKLETRVDPLTKDTLRALMVVGDNYDFPGIPLYQKYNAVSFYYQHNLKDTALAAFFLTKWNTQKNKRDTLASAFNFFTDSTSTYKQKSLVFDYGQNTTKPDTCIAFFLSSLKEKANPYNFLLLDDISVDVFLGIDDTILPQIEVYPNPSSSIINVNSPLQIQSVSVYSLTGKLLMQSDVDTFSISQLTPATYILWVKFCNGQTASKAIIKQ